MGYSRKSAAIFSSNKQMQPMQSREMFHSKNKTKPQQKKRHFFIVPPQKEAFATKLSVARKRKTTAQGRNGNRRHLSHTRRERRTSDTLVLRLKHQCRMKGIYGKLFYIYEKLPQLSTLINNSNIYKYPSESLIAQFWDIRSLLTLSWRRSLNEGKISNKK